MNGMRLFFFHETNGKNWNDGVLATDDKISSQSKSVMKLVPYFVKGERELTG